MSDPRADIKRLITAGRQAAVDDHAADLTTAIQLVRILDALDQSADEFEDE